MHQDEGIRRVSDHRLKNFAGMGRSFVESTLADGSDLDQLLLGVSEQRSAIARGLSMVSDWRSSRRATAPTRSELTSRRAFERETKGKSSATEALDKTAREPKCLRRVSAAF